MIREVNVNKYPLITIPEGTILYSGGGDTCSICPHSYKYKGQEGTFSDGKIIYLTNDINTSEFYAKHNKIGYIKKFRVFRDLILYDISEDLAHMDWDVLNYNICNKEKLDIRNGYYLDWTDGLGITFEIAVCNASDYLEYIESRKCKLMKCESEFTCNKKDLKTKEIMNKLNKGFNNCVSGGYQKESKKNKKSKKSKNQKSIKNCKSKSKRTKKTKKL